MRIDGAWSDPSSGVYVDDADSVNVIFYTDAWVAVTGDLDDPTWGPAVLYGDTTGICCSSLIDMGKYNSSAPAAYDGSNPISPDSLALWGEYDYLKTTYDMNFTIVAVDNSATNPRSDLEKEMVSAIASIGGEYTGDVANNPNDPETMGTGPRQVSFVERFEDIPAPGTIAPAARISVGNSVSVATTNDEGDGAVVQGFSQPVLRDGTENVFWTGELRAFFIDQWGYFREDNPVTGTQGQLDGPTVDRAFELEYDEVERITKLQRLNLTFDTEGEVIGSTPDGTPIDSALLDAIWDVNDVLADLDQSAIQDQRAYSSKAATGSASRYIFTWVDSGATPDGVVSASTEIYDFEWQGSGTTSTKAITPSNRAAVLGAADDTTAEAVVAFVRGKEGKQDIVHGP